MGQQGIFRWLALAAVTVVLSAGQSRADADAADQKVRGSAIAFRQNPEVLIVYEEGKADDATTAANAAGFEVVENYEPGHFLRCRPKPGAAAVTVRANTVAASEAVVVIEPNYIVSIPKPAGPRRPAGPAAAAAPRAMAASATTPNDPRFSELWGMTNIRAPEAWGEVHDSDVVVGVIDTGVDYNHEDLQNNIWTNPGESGDGKETNGVDDDGNGVVDDVHGARFLGGVASGDPMDDHSHGTHCAGTIGAVGNNNIGVAGVNWMIKIMGIKFLDADGFGATDDAVRGIDYAIDQKNRGVNIRVLSNSWGGGGFSTPLGEAIERAEAAGIVFVAAAGNSSNDNDGAFPEFPASYTNPNIIAVASINVREELSWFSSFGAQSVDLAAPGGTAEADPKDDILSTVPGNQYDFFAGTSMATPHVAGAVALTWAHPDHRSKNALEIKETILSHVRPLPALSGICRTGGTLDISFLATATDIGPEGLAFVGGTDFQGAAFTLSGSSGTALYVGGGAFQTNLTFQGIENTPDGFQGWVYRENFPFAPFDFLITSNPIGQVPYHRVYVRPAEDTTVPFSWFLDVVPGAGLGASAASDAGVGARRMNQLNEIRTRALPRAANDRQARADGGGD